MVFFAKLLSAASLHLRSLAPAWRRIKPGSSVAAALIPALGALVAAAPAQADPVGPLAIDFFVDLADGTFAAPSEASMDGAAAADAVLMDAFPVRITDSADGGWRMVAGATGRYTVAVTEQLQMTTRVGLTTTDFVDVSTPDKAAMSANTEFRYASNGWTVALQPGLEIVRRNTELTQRDAVLDARLSKAIAYGVSLSSTARYRWRDGLARNAADHEIATGRLGFIYRQPDQPRIDMTYVVRQEVAKTASAAHQPTTVSVGPSFVLALPLGETIDLTANYDFIDTDHRAADGGTNARYQHLLGMRMSWDIAPDLSGIQLQANYRCELSGATGSQGEARHAGTVSLALNF